MTVTRAAERWPGPRRPQLRALLFLIYFMAVSAGFVAFVEHHRAVAAATRVSTDLHTIKVVEGPRTFYVSESHWRRFQLLLLSVGSATALALVVTAVSFPFCDWIAEFQRIHSLESPTSQPLLGHAPEGLRPKIYSGVRRGLLWLVAFPLYLTVLWYATYWLWPE